MNTPSPTTSRPPADCNGHPHVEFERVGMSFGDRIILDGLSCHFPVGKVSIILGGSGVGKSTLLRLVGGLVHPDEGAVRVCGTDITRLGERDLYDVREKVGMMFQNGALLDSLTVFDNLAFPLREHAHMEEGEIEKRVDAALESVGLPGIDDLLPGQLSGGMVKRVALARAMILEPQILLCDEPFSGLDPISSRRIEVLLMRVNRELGVTVIMISHDVPSTLRMAGHVVVLLPDTSFEGTVEELKGLPDSRLSSFLSLSLEEPEGIEDPAVERFQVAVNLSATGHRAPRKNPAGADRPKGGHA